MPRTEACHIENACTLFRRTLNADSLDALARRTQFVRRQRLVTAASVVWAFMVSLGGHATEFISDVLRTLNAEEGWSLRYKPFWDRLAQPAFCRFMRGLFEQLCRELAVRVLERVPGGCTAGFSEILIDDGSSFGVADGLKWVFPGRFTKVTPAAVELHAHMNLLTNSVCRVTLAPDKEAERQFLPSPESLPRGSLSLRDRGYIDVPYFAALEKVGAYLICRAREDLNPTIVRVVAGLPRHAAAKWEGKRLKQLRSRKLRHDLDLLVAWPGKGAHDSIELRLVIRYVPEKKSWTWLLTNLPVASFPAEAVGQLYRLRWQIELVFKEWKSYANLHAFQSEEPHIVEGFIWASLCAAFIKRALAHWAQLVLRRPISVRLVAMSGPQLLPLIARWARRGFRAARLREILLFLSNNALPTHPERRARLPAYAMGLRERTHLHRPRTPSGRSADCLGRMPRANRERAAA